MAVQGQVVIKDLTEGGRIKASGNKNSPELNFAVVILSNHNIKKGDTYTVSVGFESGEFEAN